AFRRALKAVEPEPGGQVPVLPLVLGGDDFTALCAGRVALGLAASFLGAFEEEAAKPIPPVGDIVGEVAERAFRARRLAASAGVALVKSHFPFYGAYNLAEELLSEAKAVRRRVKGSRDEEIPCSALNFHVLEAASGAELKLIRENRRSRDGECDLWGGPYVITPVDHLGPLVDPQWVSDRAWERLEERAALVTRTDEEGRRLLPSSNLHELRSALFEGKGVADSVLRLALPRYGRRGLDKLAESEGATASLFRGEPDDGTARTRYVTSFLDALEVSELRG
ncbi:MAG: hypothetical protein ACRDJF_00750, partial [Actinomycetota bacterium]